MFNIKDIFIGIIREIAYIGILICALYVMTLLIQVG